MIGQYKLVATLGKLMRTKKFISECDTNAIGDGAFLVMRLAHDEHKKDTLTPKVWARGKIVLLNPLGETLQTMKAKD